MNAQAQTQPSQSTLKNTENVNQGNKNAKNVHEKSIFSWTAPLRPFKRRSRDFWVTVISITSIFSFILFLVEGIMPVILIISLIFLFYVLFTVEPEKIEYSITNKGIKIADKETRMENFNRFWFAQRLDSEVLVLEMFSLPGRLELVINPKDKDKIRKTLLKFIIEEEATPSKLDRATEWFANKLPQ
jgi:hypothetical protein